MAEIRMISLMRACLLATTFGVSACANTVSLPYVPTVAIVPSDGPATVATIAAVDGRHEDDPTWFGAIRSGMGAALKTLHSEKPVNDVVAEAFREALTDRGMLAPQGRGALDVNITIREFEGDQVVRRTAVVKLTVAVRDRATGQILFRSDAGKTIDNGSFITLSSGVFGSVDDLTKLVLAAMNGAIDDAVSNPNFLAALRGAASASVNRS